MRASVVLLGLAVAGCASGSYASRQAPPTAPRHSPALVSIQVKVPSGTMAAGSSMVAQVVVDNRTGRVIHVIGCLSIFQLALDGSSYHPDPAWAACAQKLTIGLGTSSYPVTLTASYLACGAGAGTPACLPGGDPMPPLPAGEYRAVLFQSSPIASAPAAIPVRVTPRSLHPVAAGTTSPDSLSPPADSLTHLLSTECRASSEATVSHIKRSLTNA
jgi:hypothetical protein